MKQTRSRSQILFGFLPKQTVDLAGKIWMVDEWVNPIHQSVDISAVRAELIRLANPWAAHANDNGFVLRLRQGYNVRVVSLDKQNGVRVRPFPRTWLCKSCNRLADSPLRPCACGAGRRFGQLHFVGYHGACGSLKSPYIPPCPTHNEVAVIFPGTASANEIQFVCPTCTRTLQKGFGYSRCQCGSGSYSFNVHRASSVYLPRTIVLVNPPSPEKVRRLTSAGGPTRALGWVLDDLGADSLEEVGLTREVLSQQLLSQGLPAQLVETMVQQADDAGTFSAGDQGSELDEAQRLPAEAEATTIALALSESRIRVSDLAAAEEDFSQLGVLYRDRYPLALEAAGLQSVELIDKFPVLTGNFGFTRGGSDPESTRLVPFEDRDGNFVVYGDLAETEALFVRLCPQRVASWLSANRQVLDESSDSRSSRLAILKSAVVPAPGDHPEEPTAGSLLLSLVHTYSHLFVRRLAVFAGIDRNSLSELLVPLHCGFFVYAAARGDFVLGGLQAVFESDLDSLLRSITSGEHRCPLDPGCSTGGAACMACLHLGEPSCRHYNRFLDRRLLWGPQGYLRPGSSATSPLRR